MDAIAWYLLAENRHEHFDHGTLNVANSILSCFTIVVNIPIVLERAGEVTVRAPADV